MRDRYMFAGQTMKVKDGAGRIHGKELSGAEFIAEDWFENVVGCSWMAANGNPTALLYAMKVVDRGPNNGVPQFSNDVVYGKINGMGYAFHINELEPVIKVKSHG